MILDQQALQDLQVPKAYKERQVRLEQPVLMALMVLPVSQVLMVLQVLLVVQVLLDLQVQQDLLLILLENGLVLVLTLLEK